MLDELFSWSPIGVGEGVCLIGCEEIGTGAGKEEEWI